MRHFHIFHFKAFLHWLQNWAELAATWVPLLFIQNKQTENASFPVPQMISLQNTDITKHWEFGTANITALVNWDFHMNHRCRGILQAKPKFRTKPVGHKVFNGATKDTNRQIQQVTVTRSVCLSVFLFVSLLSVSICMRLWITASISVFPFPSVTLFPLILFSVCRRVCRSLSITPCCCCVYVFVHAHVCTWFFLNSSPTVFISLSLCPLQLMSPLSYLSPSRCQSVYFNPSIYLVISICFGSFFSLRGCVAALHVHTHTHTHEHTPQPAFLLWAPRGHVSGTRGRKQTDQTSI